MSETELPVAPTTVKASARTAVETSAAEARLPARGKPSRNSSMIKAPESPRVTTGTGMRCRESVLRSDKSMLRG
jgi:hypothetical protein